jgi:hypothetical protein
MLLKVMTWCVYVFKLPLILRRLMLLDCLLAEMRWRNTLSAGSFFTLLFFSFFEFFHVFLLAGLTDILLICSGVLFLYRHLSACEACWRMFDYDFVERLIVHLPGMNRIISHEDDRSPCFFGP